MSEIKLLVTGHAISGNEGPCTACNFDYSWIFDHPSTLLWVDKVIITPYMEEVIESSAHPDDNGPFSNSIKKIFEVADNYGLIEVKNPKNIVTQGLSEKVTDELMRDRLILSKLFPNTVKIDIEENVPGDIFIGNEEFCTPFLWTVYVSLILSQKWNAQCLFSDHVMNFLKYKFGCSLINNKELNNLPKSFDTILSSYLPEFTFPMYVYKDLPNAQCKSCLRIGKCEGNYLAEIEQNLTKYLDIRDYDEISQIKGILTDIVKSLESKNESIEYKSIKKEFEKEKKVMSRRIHKTFPKIKRWANVSLMASAPINMVGAYTGLPEVSAIGASLTGLSLLTKGYIEHIESKSKWIGFKSDHFIM